MHELPFTLSIGYSMSLEPPYTIDTDTFILWIDCANGNCYALNVWTTAYLDRIRHHQHESDDAMSGQYLLPPDLIVASDDMTLLEHVVADLVRTNKLRESWLIPDELTAWREDDMSDNADADEDASFVAPTLVPDDCCHLLRREAHQVALS